MDFGVESNHFDALGRVDTITGTRGDFTASETRVFEVSLPLVSETTKSLTQAGKAFPYSGQVGVKYTYDTTPYRWLKTETDKLTGRTTTYNTRDAIGRVTKVTGPDGVAVTTSYDSWGRVKEIQRLAKGSIAALKTTTTYDPSGRWKEETVSSGLGCLSTRTEYDSLGRVVKTTLPDGSTEQITYDGFGQLIRKTPILKPGQASYGDFTWAYDDRGRLTETRDRVTSSSPSGRLLSKITQQPIWKTITAEGKSFTGVVTTTQDDRGYTRTEVLDLLGQKLAVVDQKGQLTIFAYDKDGHLSKAQQGTTGGPIRSYSYNDMAWLISRVEPEEGETGLSDYTMLGLPRIVTRKGRSGGGSSTIEITLDAKHRPQVITTKRAGQVQTTRTLAYREDYNVISSLSETQPYGTLTENYNYDEIGRPVFKSVTDGSQTFMVSRSLDGFGNELSLTYPSGGGRAAQVVSTRYDGINRPWIVYLAGAQRGQMVYDQITGTQVKNTLMYGNGATTSTVSDKGDLSRVTHNAVSSVLQDSSLTWTAGGLMTARGTDSFDYDELQRLKHCKVIGLNSENLEQWFTYDRYGNQTQRRFSFTGQTKPDEVLAWQATYSDGRNGLPTSVTATTPDGSSSTGSLLTGAAYDDLGCLTSVWAIPGQSSTLTAWQYDPAGRVLRETVNGVGASFLLDAEGLRFKRMKDDGSVQWTIYGFHREPLSVFEKAAQSSASKSLKAIHSATLARVVVSDPNAEILTPMSGATFAVGQAISFTANEEFNTSRAWDFGDGGKATTLDATHAYSKTGTFTVKFSAMASGHPTSTSTITITITTLPIISEFIARPSYIQPGGNSALSWVIKNATSVSINQGVGTVSGTTVNVNPTATKTYTLTAANGAGQTQKQVTVQVAGSLLIKSFTSTPGRIQKGATATLSWDITGAASVTLNNGIGVVSGTSSITVTPSSTTTYQISASNGVGELAEATTTVVVSSSLPPAITWKETLVYGFGQFLSEERASGTLYVQSDQLGSPSFLTNSAGAVVGKSKNLPFGERYGFSGEKSLRRFTNHEDQPGSAIYMQARSYLPAYGRFAQTDPAYDQIKGDPETYSLYNYVTNNPVTHSDPTGRHRVYIDGGEAPRFTYRNQILLDERTQTRAQGFDDPFDPNDYGAQGQSWSAWPIIHESGGGIVVWDEPLEGQAPEAQTGQNAPGSSGSPDGSTIVHTFTETFTSYQAAVDFAAGYIKSNYGGDKGMNTYEYAVIGYSSDGAKTFGLSPLVQGPAGTGSVNPRVGLDGVPKGSTLFFDIHSHPTGMNGKGQMQFSGYDPSGKAKDVYAGDVQFSRSFVDHARGVGGSQGFSGYTTRESHRSYLLCEGYRGMGVLWFTGDTANLYYPKR